MKILEVPINKKDLLKKSEVVFDECMVKGVVDVDKGLLAVDSQLHADLEHFEHKELAEGRWGDMPFNLQMGNIGSEVSRSLKWRGKNERRMNAAIDRALELFDLSMKFNKEPAKLKEVCRAREEFCDYFFGDNYFRTDPEKMQRYYDQFVTMSVRK